MVRQELSLYYPALILIVRTYMTVQSQPSQTASSEERSVDQGYEFDADSMPVLIGLDGLKHDNIQDDTGEVELGAMSASSVLMSVPTDTKMFFDKNI